MTVPVTRSPWLPFGMAPAAGIRLLCLPHAGAGASVYRAWGAGFAPWLGVCPVQPPGREKRRREPPLTDATELAGQLAPEIITSVRPPYAIFGHSTGALSAFETARELRRLGGPAPAGLFVAGRRAPHLAMDRTPLGGLTPGQLAVVLRRLGGTPEEVLRDADVLARIYPLLVADFAVNEEYRYSPEPPLAIPLTVFAATRDAGTTIEQAAQWHAHTSAGFRLHQLDGGHFAVLDPATDVRGQIAAALQSQSGVSRREQGASIE
jgi:medium-chain acyl-[acyl-carrier-protein] hydrolase